MVTLRSRVVCSLWPIAFFCLLLCRVRTGYGEDITLTWFDFPTNRSAEMPAIAPDGTYKAVCTAGCEKNGNCNIEQGRCECPYGYSGPDCSVLAFPACRRNGTTKIFCAQDFLQSCSCQRQCWDFYCPAGVCHSWYPNSGIKPCFVRTNLAEAEQTSDMPEEDEEGVEWHRDVFSWENKGPVWPRGDATVFEGGRVVQVALSKCPKQCSNNGVCMQTFEDEPAYCQCSVGHIGAECSIPFFREDVEGRYCPNKCSGHGLCTGNWCRCKAGWFGRDCSRSKAFAPQSAFPSPVHVRIYIYELPWQVASFVDQTGWFYGDPMYFSHEKFAAILSGDWGVRTENPYEANLFLVPLLTYQYSDNVGHDWVPPTFQRVIQYLKENSPFWQRHGGRDHIMWSTSDRGACRLAGPSTPLLITHWGLYIPPGEPSRYQPLQPAAYGCNPLSFDPLKDIVAPPYNKDFKEDASHTYTYTPVEGSPAGGPPREGEEGDDHVEAFHVGHVGHVGGRRNRLRIPQRKFERELYFAGGVRMDDMDYSGGVRQELWNLYGDKNDSDIVVLNGYADDYKSKMSRSRFCLAPYGHGWGLRITTAVSLNCVPLIIQDGVYQPFEELLPYEHFSLRLQRSDLPRLKDILKAVTPEEHLSMRRALARVHLSFGWDPPGTAYNATLAALRRRYNRVKGLLLQRRLQEI